MLKGNSLKPRALPLQPIDLCPNIQNHYPILLCRFYVDDTVPIDVQKRLTRYGAEVIKVDGDAEDWYGTFWRFLALDDHNIERVIFRDADSLISNYEAEAVYQWIQSNQPFHIMRDWGSHTELILAGLWGATAGSIASIRTKISSYLVDPEKWRFKPEAPHDLNPT